MQVGLGFRVPGLRVGQHISILQEPLEPGRHLRDTCRHDVGPYASLFVAQVYFYRNFFNDF